jgi:hypothetical protein
MSHRSLPSLGGGGGSSRLSPAQSALYHEVATWLAQIKYTLGANAFVELTDPTPTIGGISCHLQGVARNDETLANLFRDRYGTGCGRVTGAWDDATGSNLYRVEIAYQAQVPSSGRVGRILDEPKLLISGLLLVVVSASFTTSAGQWQNLARGLYELCSRLLVN